MSELSDSQDYRDILPWEKIHEKDFTTFQNNATSSGKHIQVYETTEDIHKPQLVHKIYAIISWVTFVSKSFYKIVNL